MRRFFLPSVFTLILFVVLLSGGEFRAQEHPGEHPGKEEKIKPDQVKAAILDYIRWDTKLKGGYFLIWDDEGELVWKLDFSELHKKVMVLEDGTYFMCVDFNAKEKQPDGSVKTNILDLDFWLEEEDGTLQMSMIKIHKVSGVTRFQYEKNQIRPVEK